jgi:ribonuclease P/MRP protein subunit RPP40
MEFNLEKCKVMHVGKTTPRNIYKMRGVELKTTETEKDLGIIGNSNLKPGEQCAQAAKKANQVLGQMVRAFHYRNKKVFGKLYKTFVRPHLESASLVWSPWTEKDVEVLEKLQKRAVRMMSDVKGESYEDKLKDAGLTSLRERRKGGF